MESLVAVLPLQARFVLFENKIYTVFQQFFLEDLMEMTVVH